MKRKNRIARKMCRICLEEKDIGHFKFIYKSGYSVRSLCRECYKEKHRKKSHVIKKFTYNKVFLWDYVCEVL